MTTGDTTQICSTELVNWYETVIEQGVGWRPLKLFTPVDKTIVITTRLVVFPPLGVIVVPVRPPGSLIIFLCYIVVLVLFCIVILLSCFTVVL